MSSFFPWFMRKPTRINSGPLTNTEMEMLEAVRLQAKETRSQAAKELCKTTDDFVLRVTLESLLPFGNRNG